MNEYVLSNISQEPKLYTDVDIFFHSMSKRLVIRIQT